MKLVAVLTAFLIAGFSPCSSQAQPVVGAVQQQITNNLIINPTFVGTDGWTATGGIGGNGPTHPAAPANGNGYTFTYSQGTIAQTYAINQALANVGAGVQIAGFDYGFKYRFGCANGYGGNCENLNGLQDTLNATSTITSNTGVTLYTRYYSLGANAPAPYSATFSSVDTQQRFTSSLPIENLGSFKISFTGMDAGYWGGNYGPTIKDVYSKAVYTVDPCAANPAYSPSCPNYNTVITSPNLFTGMTGPQAYAINQALSNAGAGATIHGFNYGYDYNVAGRSCAVWDIFGFCITGFNYSDAGVSTVITDSNNATLFSESNVHNGGNNGTSGTYSKQFRFGASRPISTLGGFAMAPWTSGNASITNMRSSAVYTADPCLDPLSSPSCPGYQAAYQVQQCAANPLFSSSCPGYAQAMFTQQCSANQLSDPACPGYAAAYLTYQCSSNPLYSTTCAGYETAYFDQQCSINPLYNTRCSGYATAYKNQQCSLNPLYDTTCNGYASAYHDQQCSLNSLYATTCPGYQAAYKTQQCSISALYATDCPGYATAYKNQQCTANPLYATDCSGYEAAYHNQQCTLNPLYMSDCAGYQAAYFNQQCSLDGLYDRTCPNYSTAYATKMVLEQQGTASIVATAGTVARNDPANQPVSTTTASTTVGSDGAVAVGVSKTGDSNVDKTIAPPAPSANSSTAPAGAVQLAPPPPAPQQQMAQNEPKGGGDKPEPRGGNRQEDKKDDAPKGSGGNPPPQNTNTAQASSDKPAAPTARQALQERREAAAKAEAVEKGKNLANEMGKAADMETQKAVQNVVIQAMGFTPGFDAYNKALIVDTTFYKPYSIYNNQKNIDNRANLRMFGGTDRLHNEMVDSQYNKEK